MCTYLDLVAPDSYLMVNKKLLKIVGYTTAVYFTLLLDILKEVKRKKTYDEATGFFTLKRAFVEEEIGLTTDEQKNSDGILAKLGVLQIDATNKNKIAIDTKKFCEAIVDDTILPEEMLPKTTKMTRVEKQEAKDAGIAQMYTSLFNETDEKLNELISELVLIYFKKGYCRKFQWEEIRDQINQAVSTVEEKKDLIKFIIMSGWSGIPASIVRYKETHAITGAKLTKKQTVVTNIDTITKF